MLDVGTGAGLLLGSAVKRTPRGKVIGIDLWASKDPSNVSGLLSPRPSRGHYTKVMFT